MSNAPVLMTPGMSGGAKTPKGGSGDAAETQARSGEFTALFEKLGGKGKEHALPGRDGGQNALAANEKGGAAQGLPTSEEMQTALKQLLEQNPEGKTAAKAVKNPENAPEVLLSKLAAGEELEPGAEKALKRLLALAGDETGGDASEAAESTDVSAANQTGSAQATAAQTAAGLVVALNAAQANQGQMQGQAGAVVGATLPRASGQTMETGKTVDLQTATAAGEGSKLGKATPIPGEGVAKPVADQVAAGQGKVMPSNTAEEMRVDPNAGTKPSVGEAEVSPEAKDVKVLKAETHFMPTSDLKGPSRQVAEGVMRADGGLNDPAKLVRELSQAAQNSKSATPVKTLEIQLRPENLGTVRVSMQLSGDALEITMTASSKEAAEQLQRDSLALTKVLRDAGYRTDSGNLTINVRNDVSDQVRQHLSGQGDRGMGDRAGSGDGRQGGDARGGDGHPNQNGREKAFQEGRGRDARSGVDAADLRDGIYL
ncbi:flagellar hook-length control protein FliK [Pseudovibrio exalbescens]|nr:flagellar hook-length control protein FliK [Pseudovibrio exalbescens]